MTNKEIEEVKELILKYKDNPVNYLEELGVKLTTTQKRLLNFLLWIKGGKR